MTDVFAESVPSKEIRLGILVQDAVTGLSGIAVSKHENFGGVILWGVQPPLPSATADMPEMEFIPEFLLVYAGEGVSDRVPDAADTDTLVVLGDAVEDKVTAIKGIAVERITGLNGTIHYLVEPRAAKGVFLIGSVIDHLRLIKTGPGLNKSRAKASPIKKPKAETKKKTKTVKKASAKKPKA